jgi:hypothetical protein
MDSDFFKKCSTCKKPISWNSPYFVCSVSSCNGQRTGYSFCSVLCFEAHVPGARHRDAAAVEMRAPAKPVAEGGAPARILVRPQTTTAPSASKTLGPQDVLIIASRLKEYIQATSEMNTSGSVMDVLSNHVRRLCNQAIENAKADGRKTVMDRDFEFLHTK